MSTLDEVITYHMRYVDGDEGLAARAEFAALRDADIRTMQHCDECGALLVVDTNIPEIETELAMYCPVCSCGALRATVEAQARQLEQANAVIVSARDTLRRIRLDDLPDVNTRQEHPATVFAPDERMWDE